MRHMGALGQMVGTRIIPAIRLLRRVYPFTWAGSLATFLAVGLSLRGYSYSSSSELLIGLIVLCTLAALAGAVRMERRRRELTTGELSCPPVIQAGDNLPVAELTASDRPTPMFLRLHLQLKGSVYLGGDAVIHVRAEESGTGDIPLELGLPLPLAGLLNAELRATVRDCFGLCSVEFLEGVPRTIPVLPPRYPVHRQYTTEQLAGSENQELIRNADEERYHMREYAPGDRVRDINWKASSRLPMLLTRVSPESQEETFTLPVLFLRGTAGGGHFNRGGAGSKGRQGENPQTVAERSHRLSWLMYFIAAILSGAKSVTVHLRVMDHPENPATQAEADSFFELADIDKLHAEAGRIVAAAVAPGAGAATGNAGNATSNTGSLQNSVHPSEIEGLCVFASAADPSYHVLSRLRKLRDTRYFLTRQALRHGGEDHNRGSQRAGGRGGDSGDGQIIDIPVLPDIDITALPDRWIFRRATTSAASGVAANGRAADSGAVESDYVRARLLQLGHTPYAVRGAHE